jgi:pimeloyl-ACP methyl ester carboxylesterase
MAEPKSSDRKNQQIHLQDRHRLGYAEYGDPQGKPVFYFHGTPGSRLHRHPDPTIIDSLGVRLITIDRPGYGLSDPQPRRTLLDWPNDVAALEDALGLDRFAVVGASGGGPYVAACACKIPERLTKAAMVSSGGPIDVPGAEEGLASGRRSGFWVVKYAPWLLRPLIWLLWNSGRDTERFATQYESGFPESDMALYNEPEMRAIRIASYAESARQGVGGFAQDLQIFARPWGFSLQNIDMEIYLWHGEEDGSTPVAMGYYLADTIPNCRAVFLPEEGHFVLFKYWREILSVLIADENP